jgi:hypothetical protein
VFAEALGEILNQDVYELKSDLNNISMFRFIFKSLRLALSGKSFPVSNMPGNVPDEIYLCGPIWGGRLVGPPRYFLENMNLEGKKVNLLLTADIPMEKYKTQALESLGNHNCIPGQVFLFATGKSSDTPDKETAIEHLRELMGHM